MKWKLFKRGKGRVNRFAQSGRRVTGVVTDLPAGVKLGLALAACAAVLLLGAWGVWTLFTVYYFKAQSLFVLRDLRSSVVIVTGRTLTPDLICEKLGLREGPNLFAIPIEQNGELLSRHRISARFPSCVACRISRRSRSRA